MVRFEEKRLVIEIETGFNPAEYWMDLQKGLLDLVRSVNKDTLCDETFYTVPDFLRELMPDWEDVKKMSK